MEHVKKIYVSEEDAEFRRLIEEIDPFGSEYSPLNLMSMTGAIGDIDESSIIELTLNKKITKEDLFPYWHRLKGNLYSLILEGGEEIKIRELAESNSESKRSLNLYNYVETLFPLYLKSNLLGKIIKSIKVYKFTERVNYREQQNALKNYFIVFKHSKFDINTILSISQFIGRLPIKVIREFINLSSIPKRETDLLVGIMIMDQMGIPSTTAPVLNELTDTEVIVKDKSSYSTSQNLDLMLYVGANGLLGFLTNISKLYLKRVNNSPRNFKDAKIKIERLFREKTMHLR